jgi:drug/metabolite transporter (DMT)-like permease
MPLNPCKTQLAKLRNRIGKRHLATAGGVCAILLWSLTIAFTRSISEQLGPLSGAACVYTVAAAFGIAGVLRSREQRQRIGHLPHAYLLGCGVLFVGYMLLLVLAVGLAEHRNQVLEVGLINYLWPALTLVLSVPLLGHRAKWLLFPGTILALGGVFLVLTSGTGLDLHSFADNLGNNPVPYVLGLAAAVSWALYSTLTRKLAGGRERGAVALFLAATALAMFLICLLVEEPRAWSVRACAEVLSLGVATFFAYSLWDNAMRRGNVTIVAASSYLTPFFSTVVSCTYLAVPARPQLWLGCALLIVGSLLSWFSIDEN